MKPSSKGTAIYCKCNKCLIQKKNYNYYEIGCILKTIYYIYNVVDYFPRVEFQDFVLNVAVIRIVQGFYCESVTEV